MSSICQQCQARVPQGEEQRHQGRVLCDECYIEAVWPKSKKPHYKDKASGFMRRLKTTYSILRQKID